MDEEEKVSIFTYNNQLQLNKAEKLIAKELGNIGPVLKKKVKRYHLCYIHIQEVLVLIPLTSHAPLAAGQRESTMLRSLSSFPFVSLFFSSFSTLVSHSRLIIPF